MRDVIIVGGGPAGCFLGENLAREGFEVTILEEHGEIGQPMCCAGILGAQGLKEVGLNPENWSLSELRGGVFHSPSNNSVRISRDQTEAHVIDRAGFDRSLAERAVREGAEIELNKRCTEISRTEDSVILKTKNMGNVKKFEGRMVVGADGTGSLVAHSLNLVRELSPTICAQAEIAGKIGGHDAHVYFGNEITQDFFAWCVPAGEVCRVGLGDSKGNVTRKLFKFMDKEPSLPKNSKTKMVQLTSDLIPKPGSREIYGNRVLLVGDAAGHVKPLTGGGLYMGFSGVKIASEVITKALEREPTKENLKEYEDKVREKFGSEFELGTKARNILKKMSDEDLSELLELMEEPKIRDLILENADFDHHSRLFKALMSEGPSLIKSVGSRKLMKYMKWFLSS